jgi:hypothetical protein
MEEKLTLKNTFRATVAINGNRITISRTNTNLLVPHGRFTHNQTWKIK